MLPLLVSPVHDPAGGLFPYLERATPRLMNLFSRVYLSLSAPTVAAQPAWTARLKADPLFRLTYPAPESAIGDQFLSAYRAAAEEADPAQVLHLFFLDRALYALESEHGAAFAAELAALGAGEAPVLFLRSRGAWQTHPAHYREIEGWATRAGELLLGQTLDWTWCHLAITARDLNQVLPRVRRHDLAVLAEILYALRKRVGTKEVDWLAWEDPLYEGRDREELQRERDASAAETRKRVSYVLPVIRFLLEASRDLDHDSSGPG